MNADFHINGKIIDTKRLILRQFNKNDLNDFYEYASVEGVGEMAGWKHHEDKEQSQKILDLFIRNNNVFAIYSKKDFKVIGSLGIENYNRKEDFSELYNYYGRELGFVLSKDYWGEGIMLEAVGAVIDYLFNDLNLDFLICSYYDHNIQSKRLQGKCGFKPYRKVIMETRINTRENVL